MSDPASSTTVLMPRRRAVSIVAGARKGRLRENAPLVALGIIVLVAIAWPLVAPYGPLDTHAGPALQAPSSAHLFGTDQAGRDVLSRVLAGTRISLTVGIASALLATMIGGSLGIAAAMAPRWISDVIMRCLDVMLAFPAILLAVVVAAALGTGMAMTILVIAVIFTPPLARFVRAVVIGQLEEDYVQSAKLLGTGRIRLVGYHIGVNIAIPLLVYAATVMAEAIIVEAALSYIGVGIAPPAASWGNIINDGKGLLYSGQWWISSFGGLAIFVTVIAVNASANTLNRRLDAGVERG